MTDAAQIITEVGDITAEVAAKNPALLKWLEDQFAAKEAEFKAEWEKRFGATPAVAPTPVVTEEKSQADVIASMQETIRALQQQLNAQKNAPINTSAVVMEGGDPVPHTLFLDNGTVVQNHAGLATHYTVTVPATATQDEHEETHAVVAAYPA